MKNLISSHNSQGTKTLFSPQMLPWYCFHPRLPSSRTTPTPSPSSSSSTTTTRIAAAATIRLIASDGRVKVFNHPVPASELMRQHPLHLVCRSDSFFIGQKVPALSASDHLQLGHSYFLLPSHFFHSVLSFVTLSTSLIVKNDDDDNNKARGSAAAVLRSFDIRRTEKGMLQVRVRDEMIIDKSEPESEEQSKRGPPRICSSEQLEKEYRQMVGCRLRQWSPRLETIMESSAAASSTKSRRRASMLLLMMMRRRKKKLQC